MVFFAGYKLITDGAGKGNTPVLSLRLAHAIEAAYADVADGSYLLYLCCLSPGRNVP